MSSLLSIGTSALNVQQRRLATTSHNIANASTEGYHRQRVETVAVQGVNSASRQAVGQGVEISRVRRMADGIIDAQLRDSLSAKAGGERTARVYEEMELLLTGAGDGIRAGFSEFFDAAHDLAAHPTNSAAREQLFQRMVQVTDGVRAIKTKIDMSASNASAGIRDEVVEANALLRQLASLNQDISSSFNGSLSPDMLDERDRMLDQIAERIGVTVMIQPDQSARLYTNAGQPLVNENIANQLSYEQTVTGNKLMLSVGNTKIDISSGGRGGSIMGALSGGFEMIEDVRSSLGRLATVFAGAANEINRNGLDASGALGGDLFGFDPVAVEAAPENSGTASGSAEISDYSELDATSYTLYFSAGQWQVSDSAGDSRGTLPVAGGDFEGLSINLSGAPAEGDVIKIDAVSGILNSMSLLATEADQIAVTHAVSGTADVANQGSVNLVDVRVTDVADPALADAVSVVFDSESTYEILDASGAVLQASTPYVSGEFIEFNGWKAEVNGNPQPGDSVEIYGNARGVGDNRNAIDFAQLEDSKIFEGGQRGFVDEFMTLVTRHGTKMAANLHTTEAATLTYDMAWGRRESVAGVNLDEEAAKIIEYQQAYQAASKIIMTSKELFDTLIRSV